MTQQQAQFNVGMMVFPQMTQLDLGGPYEVLGRLPNAIIHLLSETPDPVRCEYGMTITPSLTFADAPQMDLIFVPGGTGIGSQMQNDRFLDFLVRQAQNARYITSVCTGSLLLGAAGLLTGYKATTHWLSLPLLPLFGVEVVPQRVVIDRNRITGAGVSSGIDFGLVVAAEIAGREVAEAIQLQIEYVPEPPFNSGSPRVASAELVQVNISKRADLQAKRRQLIEETLQRRAALLAH
jgi:cyclohexyl-isocyanide hydratase